MAFSTITFVNAQTATPTPPSSRGGDFAFDGSEPIVRLVDGLSTGGRKPTITPKPMFRTSAIYVRKGASVLIPVISGAMHTAYIITTQAGKVVARGTGVINTDQLPIKIYQIRFAKDPDAQPLTMVVD